MNLKPFTFIILSAIISTNNLKGQDTIKRQNILSQGISLQAGLGFMAVCDESISKEKYSGWYPYVGLGFEKYHKNHFQQRILKLYQGSGIRNYNVSAKLAQIHYAEKRYYYIYQFSLFLNNVYIYIGPLTDYYLYFRQQNIASNSTTITSAYSTAVFFSLGFTSLLSWYFTSRVQLLSTLESGLLSVGMRLVNPEEDDLFKSFTFLSGVNSVANIAVQYKVSNRVFILLAYQWHLCLNRRWDHLLLSDHNLYLTCKLNLFK